MNSFVLRQNTKAVRFLNKLKPRRNGLFKFFKKLTEVTYEILTQIGKTFHTHQNHLIPYFPTEPLLFRHIQCYIEQNLEITHDTDTSDMIQNEMYTTYDNSEFDDNFFHNNSF